MEGVCHILKQNGFSFVKHDFNEPQNGKDHCDRESAVAQHCRTVYINAGHNIQTVEDIKNSLLYMNWVKNAKVSVVEIDSSVNEIKSQKNYNISNYHSAGNYDCWERYSCWKEMCWIYLWFKRCKRFEKVGSNYNGTPCEHKKPRLDCMSNDNILYCPISDCVKPFWVKQH